MKWNTTTHFFQISVYQLISDEQRKIKVVCNLEKIRFYNGLKQQFFDLKNFIGLILIYERYRKRENIGYPQIYESLKIELRYKRKISSDDLLMYKGFVSTTHWTYTHSHTWFFCGGISS